MKSRRKTSITERFLRRVRKGASPQECWTWIGSIGSHGYGQLSRNGMSPITVHRFSWSLHNNASIPAGMCICHTCDNKQCVNPAHLFLGTYSDNNNDFIRKHGWGIRNLPRGSAQPKAKLTESDVRKLRERAKNETITSLASEYGVARSTLRAAVIGDTWRHVS